MNRNPMCVVRVQAADALRVLRSSTFDVMSVRFGNGRISMPLFAALTATNRARLYGLRAIKGSRSLGADADISLWELAARRTIRQADLHLGAEYTPWEGLDVTGWPVATLLYGHAIIREGELTGLPPGGRHQTPGPSERLL